MGFDDAWPHPEHATTDAVLRKILTSLTEIKPAEMVKIAKQELDIELET